MPKGASAARPCDVLIVKIILVTYLFLDRQHPFLSFSKYLIIKESKTCRLH